MLEFTNRAKNVSPSLTLAITAKANQMKADGYDLISFAAGEPDFNTPQFIIEAAKQALDKGYTKYTAASGITAFKEAVCQKLKNDNGLDYSPEQIVISTGAKQCLFNALQAVAQEGDEVIVIAPYWLTYPELIKICGATPVIVNTDANNGFMLSVPAIKKAITNKTKAIIINTPNNPSGTVYPEDTMRELAQMLKEYPDIWVISDEIYEALSYDGNKHFSIACADEQIKERTILINGMSKAYAMTGWRIGYSASSVAAAKRMGAMQSHQTSNANTMAQHASIVALTKGQQFISEMKNVFETRRNALLECFKDFNEVECVKGGGAFYVMVNIKNLFNKSYKGQKIDSALKFSQLLLENKYVAVIPCESFGAPDYIRLTYTLDIPVIKEGAKRFKEFVKEIG